MTRCPVCNQEKERVAQHWAQSKCGYPEIDDELRSILDGLALSGATVTGHGTNRYLTIGTTNKTLASWTSESLQWLHHGTRIESQAEQHNDVYQVRTPSHPACNQYEQWEVPGDRGGKYPPRPYQLTPLTGRVWWAYAGGLQWQGEYDSQRTATFSALHDERAAAIQRVLSTAGIDATHVGKRVQWHGDQLHSWLSWIGHPVPGVEHKWASTRNEYDIKK